MTISKYKNQKFTPEEKTRWATMMHETWQAIAADAEESMMGDRLTRSIIVEFVCDANRIQEFGGMTNEEYNFLGSIYHTPSFQRWARKEMNYV